MTSAMPAGGESLQNSIEILFATRQSVDDQWQLAKYDTSALWDLHLPQGWNQTVHVESYSHFWNPILAPIRDFAAHTVVLKLLVEYTTYEGDETQTQALLEQVSEDNSGKNERPVVLSVTKSETEGNLYVTVCRVMDVTPQDMREIVLDSLDQPRVPQG